MIYSNLNAYDAYESGLQTRLDQRAKCGAMPFAIYKLLECHRDFTNRGRELVRIGEYERGNKAIMHSFAHCSYLDKSVWAKHLAAHNCFSLGRNLVGVLHGLAGDGVPAAVVQQITHAVNRRIPELLNLGEFSRVETKTDWKRVGKLLGTGRCDLDEFSDQCISLIEWVLDELIAAKPSHPSGPFRSFAEERQKSLGTTGRGSD